MSYFNTTHESGPTLGQYREKAATHDDAVLAHFRRYGGLWTPSEVHRAVMPQAPLTSARRAMTNLTGAGELERTEVKRDGRYGRAEYCWRLAGEPRQLDLLAA